MQTANPTGTIGLPHALPMTHLMNGGNHARKPMNALDHAPRNA